MRETSYSSETHSCLVLGMLCSEVFRVLDEGLVNKETPKGEHELGLEVVLQNREHTVRGKKQKSCTVICANFFQLVLSSLAVTEYQVWQQDIDHTVHTIYHFLMAVSMAMHHITETTFIHMMAQ